MEKNFPFAPAIIFSLSKYQTFDFSTPLADYILMYFFDPPYKSYTMNIFGFVLFLLTSIFLLPCPGLSQSICDDISIDSLSKHLTLPKSAQIIQKNDRGNVCEVILRTSEALAPIYAGKDFVLLGKLFQNGESITKNTMKILQEMAQKEKEELLRQKQIQEKYRKSFLQKNAETLESLVSLTLTPQKSVTDTVYLITDPACSHCKKALQELHNLLVNDGIMVKIIIYPILGEPSYQMAIKAICENYSYESYLNMEDTNSSKKTFDACKKGKLLIEKTRTFMEQATIESVPFILGNRAAWVVDGNKISNVRSHLNLSKNLTPSHSKSSRKIPSNNPH